MAPNVNTPRPVSETQNQSTDSIDFLKILGWINLIVAVAAAVIIWAHNANASRGDEIALGTWIGLGFVFSAILLLMLIVVICYIAQTVLQIKRLLEPDHTKPNEAIVSG